VKRKAVRLAILAALLVAGAASAEPKKPRFVVLVDSSGSMHQTPEIVTFPDTCAHTTCTTGSALAPDCNGCVAHICAGDPFCCTVAWDSICRSTANAMGCPCPFAVVDGIGSRGDGSAEHPGCDVDGDGLANDSRLYQAKEALKIVLGSFGEVELALARFSQTQGGGTCSGVGACPLTPGGENPWTCASGRCQLSGSFLGSAEGRCNVFGWSECKNSPPTDPFDCDSCSTASLERLWCVGYDHDRVCSGGTSPLDGSAVTCLSAPDNRFLTYAGGYDYGAGCDPMGADVLVSFPATGYDDNYAAILSWIDHVQPTFTGAELRATGATPIAAALRDVRSYLTVGPLVSDLSTPCRSYAVILLSDGGETCETVADAVAAAAALQDVTVTRTDGAAVTVDVDVYVIGFAICPPGDPMCQTIVDLDAIAAAGGTSAAFRAKNQLELQAALSTIVAGSIVSERCNGADDDCDTLIDEDFPGLGTPCSVGIGPCARTGTTVCTADQLGTTCSAVPGPPGMEVCNGLDDDCDGLIDDGIPCTPCTLQPEVCNGTDDDCDMKVDEALGPPFGLPCGTDVGVCAPGLLSCTGGAANCVGGVGPTVEICDGADNNCNSATDESDPLLGTACPDLPGGGTLTSDAGECRFGIRVCTAGALECVGAIGPVPETCNLRDDDCDAATDEDFPELGTVCSNGMVGACAFSGTYVCAVGGGTLCTAPPGSPSTEICDGKDNDCDGATDEAPLPVVGSECAPAFGLCAPGLWECVAGVLDCGMPATGTAEECNGADDDCDGLIDEGSFPEEGLSCVDPGFESVGDTGECEYGTTICLAGAIVCDGYVGPKAEICNGIDDDCDGLVDDEALCPDPDNVCHEGLCVVPCAEDEFPCPTGYVCIVLGGTAPPGQYCVPDPCAGVDCPAGFACEPTTGTCVDLCVGVACATGQVCKNGFCLDCFDLPSLCAPGEICLTDAAGVGQCQANPCQPNPCAADQICLGGDCLPPCACAENEVCRDGACQPDLCAQVSCPFGQLCDPATGDCVNPACAGIACAATEVCVALTGECIPDPCLLNACPAGTVCVVDAAGGFVCDAPPLTQGDRVTAAGGGCGCATGARTSPKSPALLLLAAAVLGRAPRRRTRRRR
jgi:hypothetical protein